MVERPISAAELAGELVADDHGATVMFEGTVRNRNRGREVTRLQYEAYEPMAEETLHAIASEAVDQFRVGAIAAMHRTGRLDIGEVSIAIAVCSAHREHAFAATRYVIEQVKVRLPVWKREEYADGTTRWLDGTAPGPAPTADRGTEQE